MTDQEDESRGATAAGEPFRHTRWQTFIREVFKVFGPAQTGLPPYATPAEREAWRLANVPLPAPKPSAQLIPPGYRIATYTDQNGVVHRSLVPEGPADAPPDAGGSPPPA